MSAQPEALRKEDLPELSEAAGRGPDILAAGLPEGNGLDLEELDPGGIDVAAAERAIGDFLRALGRDLEDPHL
ncbi:MAG TPA: hypothetical protein VGN49_01980, partial [Micrococcaceae bacterium]|nr:hypothetical protein [Micrococcaceae bacterium]